jgi:hypothetical protein
LTLPPVQIFPTAELAAEASSPINGVVVFGNALYCVLITPGVGTGVFQSLNSGAAWSQLDLAGAPTDQNGVACFDGGSNLIVCLEANATGQIYLQNFSLLTGDWGAPYATGGPTGLPIAVYQRAGASDIVAVVGFSGEATRLTFANWNGAIWASQDAGQNITTLPGWDSTQTHVAPEIVPTVLDGSNSLHIFFQTASSITTPGAQWNNLIFYQEILANNTLGSFFEFPGQQPVTGPQQLICTSGRNPVGRPIILNGSIVLPCVVTDSLFPSAQYPTLFIGTANVWTLSPVATGIDPAGTPLTQAPTQAPGLWDTGTGIIVAIWPRPTAISATPDQLQMAQTSNLLNPTLGWTAQTIFDGDNPPSNIANFYSPSAQPQPGTSNIMVTSDAVNQTTAAEERYWFGTFTPTPLAAPTFFPAPGPYPTPQTVTLSGPTDAIICYRTDGVDPTASVPGTCDAGSITYTGPIAVLESETVCAISTEVGQTNSAPNCATYSIAATQPFSVILRGVKRFKTGPKEFICKPVDEKAHNEAMAKLTEWIG